MVEEDQQVMVIMAEVAVLVSFSSHILPDKYLKT